MPETSEADQKLIETSMKRFDLAVDAEREHRVNALDDLKFRAGEQWPADQKTAREAKGRPCLTINVLPARERQVLNDQRQNRPAIDVHPVDDKADPETAKLYKGVIRHIEVDSNADVAYDTATAMAVRTGGPGWIRVVSEYETPLSMNQVLKIKRVRNSFNVYSDCNAQEPDRSDMKWLHAFCDYSKDEYKQEFGESAKGDDDEFQSVGDAPPDWLSEDGIRVVEYWYLDTKADVLYLMKDGSAQLESKLGEGFVPTTDKRIARDAAKEPIYRATNVPVVRCCVHNAKKIIEKKEWAGQWIPFVPVLGDELEVDGKLILEGMVRHVKDSVRMSNVMSSAKMEAIGMIPKQPWLVAEGQIPEEYKRFWDTANSEFWPYLVYKATDSEGRQLPPPQRVFGEPAVQAITDAELQHNDNVKAIQGIYDAQLGARSNETSGAGINQRKRQGELSNFHYVDNLTRAIRHLGRILVDLIPKIYDTPRVLRIIGEDGTPKQQMVNGSQLAENDPRREGLKHMYDLGVGTYDVVVSSGPSYQTKRLEAVATQLEFLKYLPPEIGVNVLDLVAANMDFPQSEAFVERLKKLLPPGMADDEEQMPIPPQAQQKLTQQQQMISELTQHLNDATEAVKGKKLEMDTKMEIEKLKIEAQVAIAEINTKAQSESERAQFLSDLEQTLLKHGHEYAMQREQQNHQADLASQAQAAQQQQQAESQQHEATQADLARQAAEQQQNDAQSAQ